MSKGFGSVPQGFTVCDVAMIETPTSKQKFSVYRSKKKKYADIDDLLRIYGISEQDVSYLKIRNIRPKGKFHPESQFLRGVELGEVHGLIEIAAKKGSPEGRLRAMNDSVALVEKGAEMMGIRGAYITPEGQLVPVDKEGNPIKEFSFKVDDDFPLIASVLENSHPFIKGMHLKLGCPFYRNIAQIGLTRVQQLQSNHKISHYIETLVNGLMARNPELEECNDYIFGLIYFVTSGFSEDRRQIIVSLITNEMTPASNHPDVLEDLMLALNRVASEHVVAPGKSERLLSKEDLRALDHVFQGEHRILEFVEKLEEIEKENKEKDKE